MYALQIEPRDTQEWWSWKRSLMSVVVSGESIYLSVSLSFSTELGKNKAPKHSYHMHSRKITPQRNNNHFKMYCISYCTITMVRCSIAILVFLEGINHGSDLELTH